MKNIIYLLVDRLHIGFWGAYGNSEIETPTLDRLAVESFLADRFYVDTTDPVRQCRSWWRGVHALVQKESPTLVTQLNAAGYRTVLLTDDPDIAYSGDANDFSDVQLLPTSDSTEPCIEIDETHLCRMLATAATTAESLARPDSPYCLWCHLRGFDEIWDFPLFLREKYCGEGDPEPYPDVIPPLMKAQASDFELQERLDFRQAVVSAYMGGVTMFDELLEMLIEPLRDGTFGDETLFLLAGTRGVLFGEHGLIGIPPTNANFVEPLVSSLVQVPLAVRFPDGFGATVRSDALLQPPDMTRLLYEWLELPMPDTLPCAVSAEPHMLDLIREESQNLRDRVLIVASPDQSVPEGSASCLVTQSWSLQELDPATNADMPFALHVKPDDRWDVNNVANRCGEIVEQLLAVRADLTRRLHAGDITPPEQLPGILRERFQ
ncbi:MAG: sulfatase-like hydrolase/transferase [Planctomycetaceae bacterium]|nr:sulfatase-like hydrolase/transferase [Planctomycetaceae bacterium]